MTGTAAATTTVSTSSRRHGTPILDTDVLRTAYMVTRIAMYTGMYVGCARMYIIDDPRSEIRRKLFHSNDLR